jgi:antitoxin component YwqK of YwqJK toxin-antitoxin module
MILYWINGKVRSDIIYYQGQDEVTHEYYENGNPEIAEEYAKKLDYLMYRTFWYENGKTQSDLQLVDKKKKKYSLKEYYENGQLQDEGTMQYYAEIDNFMKEGTWKVYDETGKLVAVQEYVRNQMTEEKKM